MSYGTSSTPASSLRNAFRLPSPVGRTSAASGSAATVVIARSAVTVNRNASGKHSAVFASAEPPGSPSTIRLSTRDSRPIALKDPISSPTQRDAAASGEQNHDQ